MLILHQCECWTLQSSGDSRVDVVFWWSRVQGYTLRNIDAGPNRQKAGTSAPIHQHEAFLGYFERISKQLNNQIIGIDQVRDFKSAQCIKFDPLSIRHFLRSIELFRSRTHLRRLRSTCFETFSWISEILVSKIYKYNFKFKFGATPESLLCILRNDQIKLLAMF